MWAITAHGDQLERLVAHVVDHPGEAGEVAAHSVVPAVVVGLGGQVGGDLDEDVRVHGV
jgi:hypothetical protein